jgi:hypothetical protein
VKVKMLSINFSLHVLKYNWFLHMRMHVCTCIYIGGGDQLEKKRKHTTTAE